MSGDFSRQTFDPRRDYGGVLMQQGRVLLDADWNELVEILDRRWRAETLDIVGRAAVPKQTPEGFKIIAAGGTFTIARGRIYVDGLLVENHGFGAEEFDPQLTERRGKDAVPYDKQPYFPAPPALPASGTHLIYLDAWQREVTHLEAPELIEKAVGVDSTARLQTVWQVKAHPPALNGLTCSTPDEQIPGWLDVIRPSGGRLSVKAVGVAPEKDPCLLPPGGGYRGLENRLYRVEIHDPGAPGTATFKWSRDRVESAVTALTSDTLNVASLGRDGSLRFRSGDIVEVTDDRREFGGKPGMICKIVVDDATQTLKLSKSLDADLLPGGGADTPASRHTRVRRWDQTGVVLDANGKTLVDLNTDPSGVIKVPLSNVTVALEDGIQITFAIDAVGGDFRSGDYWTFAARTADASVEPLTMAPPRGVHHHYCRLAVMTFPAQATDCRTLWPPDVGGAGCDCTRCVTPESHASGTLTIQKAIDEVKDKGGKVCLEAGDYQLGDKGLIVTGARSLRIEGKGWQTQLVYVGTGPAVEIADSTEVTLEGLAIITMPRDDRVVGRDGVNVVLRDSAAVTLRRCFLVQARKLVGPAIGLEGVLVGTVLSENVLVGAVGVGTLPARSADIPQTLLTAGLLIEDNVLACAQSGVALGAFTVHVAATRVCGNVVRGCTASGLSFTGMVSASAPPLIFKLPAGTELVGCGLTVAGNTLGVDGDGIVIGVDDARVEDNDFGPAAPGRGGNGVLLANGLDRNGVNRCQILANRIVGLAGAGVAIRTHVVSAIISQNIIERTVGGGVVMDDDASAEQIVVENNLLAAVGPESGSGKTGLAGIRLVHAGQARVAANSIIAFAQQAVQFPSRAGIQVIATPSVRLCGNELNDIGPVQAVGETAAIEVWAPFDQLDVTDNRACRGAMPLRTTGSAWVALRVVGPTKEFSSVGGLILAFTDKRSLTFTSRQLRVRPITSAHAAVHGNYLESWGSVAPAADINVAGTCTVSHNRCRVLSNSDVSAAMTVSAGTIVFSSNQVHWPTDRDGVRLLLSDPKAGKATVLGNITFGRISLNNQALPAPWDDLNVIAPL